MSSGITLSAGVRQNLLSLQATADMMATTQNRLATGKKVNSALDNPSSFFTSQALSDRASDLNSLLDSIGQATKTLDAANNGITSLTKLVQSAQATARSALQAPNAFTSRATVSATSGGLSTSDLTALIAGTGVNATSGTGTVAVDTSSVPDKVATFAMNDLVADTAATTTGSAVGTAVNANALNNLTGASSSFASGDAIVLTGSSGTATLNVTTATTGTSDANNIRADDTLTNLTAKLTVLFKQVTGDTSASVSFDDTSHQLTFQTTDNTQDFTLAGNTSKLGVTAGTYKPTNNSLQGVSAGANGAFIAGAGASTVKLSALTSAPTNGQTLTITSGTTTKTVTFSTAGAVATNDGDTTLYVNAAGNDLGDTAAAIQAAVRAATGDVNASATYDATGKKFSIKLADTTKSFTIGGTQTLGLVAGSYTNAAANNTVASASGSALTLQATGGVTGTDQITDITTATEPQDGNTLTITGAAGTQTITYVGAGGAAAVVDSTHRTIGVDQTLNSLRDTIQDAVRDATGDSGATVDFNGAVANGFKITLSDKTKTFTIGATGRGATGIGLTVGQYDPAHKNTTTGAQNLVANSASFNVSVGSNSAQTLYFGTSSGQIQNRRDLIAQLNTVSNLSVSSSAGNTATSTLTLANATSSDLKSSITINGSNSSVVGFFGLSTAAANTTHGAEAVSNGTNATISATNLLTQVSGLTGKSLTVGVGSNSKSLTFGNGINQVSTYSELASAIASVGGLLSKDAGNKLSIATSAANLKSSLNIQGSAASVLGVNTGSFSGTGKSLDGTTLTVNLGSGSSLKSSTFTFGSESGQVKTLDQLNAQLTADHVGVQASLDSDGKLSFATTNDSASKTFSVSGTAAVTGFGSASAFNELASSTPVFGGTGDTQRRNLVTDYNNVISQIDTLAGDSSYNGVNLLGGDDLQVIFNENNTSKLTIKGVKFDSAGLGLDALASDGSDFLDSGSINSVLSKLDTATRTLRSQSSKFGSNLSTVQTRQDFTKSMINTLQTGSDALVLADTNEEGANMLALQTRQQLSTTALSLANQANQAVLRLF